MGSARRYRPLELGTKPDTTLERAVQLIPLDQITRNPDQPRETFPAEHIERLAASIKAQGLLQAITVRPIGPDRYMIVAGECRYRAHQLLGAETIRAEVVEMSLKDMALRAIIENVQRQDMNPMEEARAFQRLIDAGMTIPEIVEQLGFKGRDRVQNRLNLLALVPAVQSLVASNQLTTSMASAIALAPPEHQTRIVREITAGTLRTVDQVRHAGQAMRDAADQLDAFAELPAPSKAEVEAVSALERKIDAIARMVLDGFKDGQCVAAQRVRPDRVKTMADQLTLIRKHVIDMEHQLRCVIAQQDILTSITTEGAQRSEDPRNQAAVGVPNNRRREEPRDKRRRVQGR
jgi:ParB family chromosome partitioning protein